MACPNEIPMLSHWSGKQNSNFQKVVVQIF